jgi:hypothetical protein
LKINLEDLHFDTIETIEIESQAVLNTLREHNLQNAFKHDRNPGKDSYVCKGGLDLGWWLRVSF